jgi:hypothetical protein
MEKTGSMLPGWFVYVAALVSLAGVVPYMRSTLSGETLPHRVTWVLWMFIPLVTFAVQRHVGVGIQSVMTLAFAIGPLMILLASFLAHRGMWAITKFDWLCAGLSVFGLVFYIVTRKGNLAIGVLIAADLFAAIPTFRKSFTTPESESWSVFLAGLMSAVLTLLTVTDWNFATIAFSACVAATDLVQVVFVRFRLGPRLRGAPLAVTRPG